MEVLYCCCMVSLLLLPVSSLSVQRLHYTSIFSFGDSFTDTGNNPVVFKSYSLPDPVERLPYGMTFFGHPSGRISDGRLVLDFIAEKLGLPLVPPFLAHNGSFRRGANFAVGGATALDVAFFRRENVSWGPYPLNTSLSVQLEWFESMKPSLCSTTQECKDFFSTSLFFVGEFGVNDYHFSFSKKNLSKVRSYVPYVIGTISNAIERLIDHGATSLVVPGVVPSGCIPSVLASFPSAHPAGYDSRTGCMEELNELGMHHNSLLQEALETLRGNDPDVQLIYADFFNPIMEMVRFPQQFDITRSERDVNRIAAFEKDVLRVCCGGGGRYNFNLNAFCGTPGATTCKYPSAYLFWDGTHLTEAAYHYIANDWLESINSFARASS